MIYLDYAAATPIDDEVLQLISNTSKDYPYNPSGVTKLSRDSRKVLDEARSSIAKLIGSKPSEIIFTAGGTEANNLAISGALRKYPDSTAVYTELEHRSVKVPIHKWGEGLSVSVDQKGQIIPQEIENNIQDDTVIVTVAYVDSELGIIQPIKEIAKVIENVREDRYEQGIDTPIYLHVDASQAAGYLDLNVNRLGIDLMTVNGGKVYGPKQAAVLFIKKSVDIEPLIYGGGQELGLRSGTENIAYAKGLALALKKAENRRKKTVKKINQLKNIIVKNLDKIEGAHLNGDMENRLPNNINVRFDGLHAEDLVLYLEQAGFIVGTGAACSVGKETPSDALLAIGLNEEEANQSIRITLSHLISKKDVILFNKNLTETVNKVRKVKQQ